MGYCGYIPAVHYGEEDVCLYKGKGVVYWVQVNPSSDEYDLALRDGSDTGADYLIRFIDAEESCRLYRFDPPLPFHKGLFVDLIEDIRSFTIAYDPVGE